MKERLRDILNSFFISVTLINMAMLILGFLFRPEQKFGYDVFLYPLLYGLIGIIPSLIITTKKELSVSQVIIRKVLQCVLIAVLMLAFMFAGQPFSAEQIPAAVGVGISVIIIFILVNVIEWLLDLRTAKSMTEDLLKFQESKEGITR